MRIENPFHEGELLVQQQAGETAKGEQNGRIIADSLPKGASKFIEQQLMVVLGSVDEQKNIWASILLGNAGFVKAIAPQTVEIDRQQVFELEDPFWTNIKNENRIGMLVIELETRRRLRINGAISRPTADKLSLQVTESYPNCPKYIQRRQLFVDITPEGDRSSQTKFGRTLTSQQQKLIALADTFFVASFHSTRGVDVSHRGGNPGFIQLIDNQTIRIPDYQGNGMFNTLGNLIANPRAGLIFIDFKQNYILQLTGKATIIWDLEDRDYPTGGTQRYWDFKIKSWLQTDLPQMFNHEFIDYSHHNPNIQ